MRYLATLIAAEPVEPPPAEFTEALLSLGQEAKKAGVLLDQGDLLPSTTTRLSVENADLNVVDEPSTESKDESKELLRYSVYEVDSKEEAVEWTKRYMALHRDLWPGWSGEAQVVQIMQPAE